MTKAKSKRPGGKQRDAIRRDAQRAAKRGAGYDDKWISAYEERVGPPPYDDPDRAYQWLTNAMLFAADATMRDVGIPPEQRVQRLAVVAPQLVRAADPARLSAKLERLEEEQARLHVLPVGVPVTTDTTRTRS